MFHRSIIILILTTLSAFAVDEEAQPLWPEGHAAREGLDAKNVPHLYIYQPLDKAKRVPVIILVCPGGGYRGQTIGDEGHSVAKWYQTHGITGVTLKYRLPKKGKWSPTKTEYSTLRDAQRAVQLMRHKTAELGLPNAKIGIVGFSAGGHLACMTATRCRTGSADSADPVEKLSSRPDFACLIYPVVSFMDHGHGGSCGNLLGKDATEENRKTYSGEFNVSKDTPPIFMVHANDDFVKVENSVVFYQALNKQNIPVEMHIVSRGGHGFFNGKGWGIPAKDELRFTRSGGMWPAWTLNWMQEETLVSGDWQWPKTRAEVKAVVDPK